MSSQIELSIHFTSDETKPDSPISVSLLRVDTGAMVGPVGFEVPLGDEALGELGWYLEEFDKWPVGPDYDRAEEIEAKLEGWGRVLLASVMGEGEAGRLWQQFVDAGGEGKLLTVDAIDPRVLRLPWELLADEGGHVFAQGIGVRRRLREARRASVKPFALPVRVLVVVARPDDAGFADPRAHALPLLDALEGLGEEVVVEFLYPPTLKALSTRLRSREKPAVHVVHFDGHGVYDPLLGLGYLLFENEQHEANPVDAHRLGTRLRRRGVPLMVLSACQSATQKEGNPYASVAARLVRAGVGSVLAMTYSMIESAQKFVGAFYGALAEGRTVGEAVDEGRFELLADEGRHTLTRRDDQGNLVEETLRVRNWFLPALYQQNQDPALFQVQVRGTSKVRGTLEVPRTLTDPHAPGGLPAEPIHGFHGRTREMLHLERALAKHSIVVLHGFGGMGKTALAAEAGRWFYRTGRFAGGAAFVSFEHACSLNQLCSWVGQAISADPDFMLGEGEPVERVAELLRQQPALLILDHFESVVGKTPLIPAEEVSSILDAVFSWSQTSARILITTRDSTLNDARFMPSKACTPHACVRQHLPLQGLAKDDALRLAKAVLDDHEIERATIDIERSALETLMERLGGHPLSLYLALPHLREHTPADLSARFEELLPGFTEGAAQEGNKSLAVSLDLFLRRLGEDARAALPALALFQGGCMEVELLHITEMDPTLWQAARTELEQAALVTVEPVPGVAIPFLRFHPTLMPYLASQLPAARRAALEERYWRRYDVIANYLVHSDSQPSHQARAIALRELPNLQRALDLAIAAATASKIELEQKRAITDAIELARRIAKFLDHFGRWRERDALMAKIGFDTLSHRQVASSAAVTKAEFLMISQQAEVLRQQGQAAKAEQLSRHLLARLEASAAYDAAYDSAMTLARLGRCLAAQGQPKQAIAWHKRALQGFERLSQSDQNAKEMLGKVYGELGNNLATVGHFDKAQQAYESALEICKEVDHQRALGVTLSRMGELALMRGDLAEAGQRYREALDTFRRLGEPPSEAIVWHQLGIVAQKAQNWDEAERCYREAVRIGEQIRDLPELSKSFNQLARLANGAGRLDDAEQWYLRAQDGFEQTGQPHHAAIVSHHLAHLYLSQARLGLAADYARRAVAIKEALDLSAEPWTSYNILARIALAQDRADEAAPWRRKAQDSYAAYVGAAHQLPKWAPSFIAAVVAAVGGDQAAIEQVEEDLPQPEADGWEDLSQAIRRLLSGQRDFEALRVALGYKNAYIIRLILSQLPEEAPAPPAQAMEVAQATETSAFDKAQAPEEASEALASIRIRKQWEPVMQAVVAACRGDAEAARNIAFFLDSLSQQEPLRDLGAVLTRILAGERDANALLAGLEGADLVVVQDVLGGLGVA